MPLSSTNAFIVIKASQDSRFESIRRSLEQYGFNDIIKTNEDTILNRLNQIAVKGSQAIFILDARDEWIPLDFSCVKNLNSGPILFLRYQSPASKGAVVLGEDGRPMLLSNEDLMQWADAYTFAGAALVRADFLKEHLKNHSSIDLLFNALLKTPQIRGIPVAAQLAGSRPCLFLDRDGIVIEDTGYIDRIEDVRIIPAVIPLIRWAKSRDWLVIVISNQSGVARGKFTEAFLKTFTQHLSGLLKKEDADPDGWFYCPYYEKGSLPEYSLKSVSRKPKPGLILKAASQFPVDIGRSFMVGDKISDRIELDGLQSLIIQGLYPLGDSHKIFADLRDALSYLEKVDQEPS